MVKFLMLAFDLTALILFAVREGLMISAMEEYNLDPKGVADFSSVFVVQRFFIDIVGIRIDSNTSKHCKKFLGYLKLG